MPHDARPLGHPAAVLADPVTQVSLGKLAAALRCREQDIIRLVIEKAPLPSDLDDQSLSEMAKIAEATSAAITETLMTGTLPEVNPLAEVGNILADGSVSLAYLITQLIAGRDAWVAVMREEADRLSVAPELANRVASLLAVYFDHVLVSVAERFDARRKELQELLEHERAALAHQALHDSLTRLPNRTLFLERLASAVEAATRRSIRSAILFVDVDRFKSINDVAGHAAGDHLLIGVARRLKETLRPGDMVARLGGDEFVVLCENLYDAQSEAVSIAERLLNVLSKPFVVGGSEFFTSVSIGIAFVQPGDDPETLIARADSAMYMAKQSGRSRFEIYHPDFDKRATRRAELINGLHRALARNELSVYFQPVRSLPSGMVVAMEALLRWQHPTIGSVAPEEFIPLAEESGTINALGTWVLEVALRKCREWRESGHEQVGVSVNISASQLADPSFSRLVANLLAENELPAEALTIEITERVLVDEGSVAEAMLKELDELGVRLTIDDFGIGYSAFSYLSKLPVDGLKIDRNFIAGLGERQDAAVVTAMVNLAHALGLSVVADGVETEAELAVLREVRCDGAQGFLLGAPQPFAALEGAFSE